MAWCNMQTKNQTKFVLNFAKKSFQIVLEFIRSHFTFFQTSQGCFYGTANAQCERKIVLFAFYYFLNEIVLLVVYRNEVFFVFFFKFCKQTVRFSFVGGSGGEGLGVGLKILQSTETNLLFIKNFKKLL